MTAHANACFTFNAACDMAIEMETKIFKNFLNAVRIVKDKAANEILQEATSVRLGLKQKLEMVALKEALDDQDFQSAVPIMNLANSIRDCDLHKIGPDADNRKALAYAIMLSKDALEFYRTMAEQCSGAPMATLFKSLGDDQTRYLQELEDTYEEHFLTEG